MRQSKNWSECTTSHTDTSHRNRTNMKLSSCLETNFTILSTNERTNERKIERERKTHIQLARALGAQRATIVQSHICSKTRYEITFGNACPLFLHFFPSRLIRTIVVSVLRNVAEKNYRYEAERFGANTNANSQHATRMRMSEPECVQCEY